MPKNLHLFGAHLQRLSAGLQKKWPKTAVTKMISPKAYGRPPSASSQMALWGGDDWNYRTKVSPTGTNKTRIKQKPLTYCKDIKSEALNTVIPNLRVTPAALYHIDEMGGFDNYISRTSPEELRSNMGEKMRQVVYFYQDNPEIRNWGLPWKVFLRKRSRADPHYARYYHLMRKEKSERTLGRKHAKFSPYFLPQHPENVARQTYLDGSEFEGGLNLWWKKEPGLEKAFRERLKEAKSFEQRFASHREPDGFRTGEGMGGGGRKNLRRQSKTHRNRFRRPY